MSKLIVFSGIGTLTTPISGADLPESPIDQEIFPEVRSKLEALRKSDWSIAIVSNQDCEWNQTEAQHLKAGSEFKLLRTDDVHTVKIVGGEWVRHSDKSLRTLVKTEAKDFYFKSSELVLTRHKSIDTAMREIQFTADLCGIWEAIICPTKTGKHLYSLGADPSWSWRSMLVSTEDSWMPGSGMLDHLKELRGPNLSRCVMVGKEPEDRIAADLAQFEFIDGEDLRSGRVVV